MYDRSNKSRMWRRFARYLLWDYRSGSRILCDIAVYRTGPTALGASKVKRIFFGILAHLLISALKFELSGIISCVNIFYGARRPLLIPYAGIECPTKTLPIDRL